MLFAAGLILERETLQWGDLPAALMSWVQDAGMVATVGLALFGLYRLLTRQSLFGERGNFIHQVVALGGCVAFGCIVAFLILLQIQGTLPIPGPDGKTIGQRYTDLEQLFLTIGGAAALLAVITPVVLGTLGVLSGRRIFALAKLSILEAIRGRVIWVFALMGLVYLFSDWFIAYRDRDQVRAYMNLIYGSTVVLMLMLAALLGSFSIPNDVARQTIHTIVTKPVQPYEIALGRFLGYGFLLTVGLLALSGLSLVYVSRGVTAQAAEESYKARVPLFGDRLTFFGTGKANLGENVGREWTYRSYIRGKGPQAVQAPRQYAIWTFDTLPSSLASWQQPIPFEFTFDIYRMTKGTEAEGVFCNLIFAQGTLEVQEIERTVDALRQRLTREQGQIEDRYAKQRAAATRPEERNRIEEQVQAEYRQVQERAAGDLGVYLVGGVEVSDYVTQSLTVPPAFLRALMERAAREQRTLPDGTPAPVLKVLASVGDDISSRQQMVGMARRDLYLLSAEWSFWQNYSKWVVGLWCSTMLVLGVAVACSTYLSGIVSLLVTLLLCCGAGMVKDFIQNLAEGRVPGGGPFEAANRILSRLPMAGQLEQSPTTTLIHQLDAGYRYWLGLVLKTVPDMHRFNLTEYVAAGFNIPTGEVLFLDNILPLIGYLLPWGVLAFYLINSREVANPT